MEKMLNSCMNLSSNGAKVTSGNECSPEGVFLTNEPKQHLVKNTQKLVRAGKVTVYIQNKRLERAFALGTPGNKSQEIQKLRLVLAPRWKKTNRSGAGKGHL